MPITPMPAVTFRHRTHQISQNCGVLNASSTCTWRVVIMLLPFAAAGVQPRGFQWAWVPVHLGLRALSELQLVAAPLATHALTIGAIGGLTIGMMTRTARGHTARPLVADGLGVLWSAGFALYAVRYWPVLTRPRLDGRPV
jgi:hypothetical protein